MPRSLSHKESVYCPVCKIHSSQERALKRGTRYCGTCGETFTLRESRDAEAKDRRETDMPDKPPERPTIEELLKVIDSMLRFMQTKPEFHFCGFCRSMNFFHSDECPIPQVYAHRYGGQEAATETSKESLPVAVLQPRKKALWESDERPDDSDNPCAVCKQRMPINVLTAMFGCHYQCVRKENPIERALLPSIPQPAEKCGKCGHDGSIRFAVNGTCAVAVPVCSDDYHGNRPCGCKCEFSPSPERVQGDAPEKESRNV